MRDEFLSSDLVGDVVLAIVKAGGTFFRLFWLNFKAISNLSIHSFWKTRKYVTQMGLSMELNGRHYLCSWTDALEYLRSISRNEIDRIFNPVQILDINHTDFGRIVLRSKLQFPVRKCPWLVFGSRERFGSIEKHAHLSCLTFPTINKSFNKKKYTLQIGRWLSGSNSINAPSWINVFPSKSPVNPWTDSLIAWITRLFCASSLSSVSGTEMNRNCPNNWHI